MIMKWKHNKLLVISIVASALLTFAGISLELFFARTIKGTFVIRPPDFKAKNPAAKPSSTTLPSEDILQSSTTLPTDGILQSRTSSPTEDAFIKVAERQRTRKQQLKKYCLEHLDQTPQPKRQQLQQFLIDDDYRYIYCSVPKVGSTPMKRTLLSLRNDSDSIRAVHSPRLWKHMSAYNASDSSKRLVTHFKFLFVREPFHRLLSGYKDKFFGKNRLYTNGLREKIVKAYRPQDVEKVATKTNNVTFIEFLKYIVTSSNYLALDPHWRQCELLCFPCSFKYDFIGHFETLVEDVPYMLKKAGIGDRVAFPPYHSSRAASDFMTYYSQVPREIIFKLGDVFRNDFEMFGYPFPGPLEHLLTNYTSR